MLDPPPPLLGTPVSNKKKSFFGHLLTIAEEGGRGVWKPLKLADIILDSSLEDTCWFEKLVLIPEDHFLTFWFCKDCQFFFTKQGPVFFFFIKSAKGSLQK